MGSNDELCQDQLISDEYKIWKKNCPFLYDLMMTHTLEWPSLTSQWLPDRPEGADSTHHRILLGTHTTEEQNYILILKIRIPDAAESREHNPKLEFGEFSTTSDKISVEMMVSHDGEVNRARYMPQNAQIVATKTNSSDLLIFSLKERPSLPGDSTCTPQIRLTGHSKEGFGLSWNPKREGYLLSGSEDSLVCLWDVSLPEATLPPLMRFQGHSDVVGDVAFHPSEESLFASVSDDNNLMIWDVRAKDCSKPLAHVLAHSRGVNCVSFNPFFGHVLATGGADSVVSLWDMRNLQSRLHALDGHIGEVYQVEWSPHHETILASGGSDRRVVLWDLSKIGDEVSTQDADDGPPELMFLHAGHTSKVSDFSWNSRDPWLVGSVADDNVFQIWQIAENVLFDDDPGVLVDEEMDLF